MDQASEVDDVPSLAADRPQVAAVPELDAVDRAFATLAAALKVKRDAQAKVVQQVALAEQLAHETLAAQDVLQAAAADLDEQRSAFDAAFDAAHADV